MRTYIHSYVHAYMCMHTYIHVYICTHPYIHTCTHTWVFYSVGYRHKCCELCNIWNFNGFLNMEAFACPPNRCRLGCSNCDMMK